MKPRFFLFICGLSLLAVSCLREGASFQESPSIDVDRSTISITADTVSDTLFVTANRGWTVQPGDEWVTFENAEVLNLGGSETITPLILKFEENQNFSDRTTSFKIIGEGFEQAVTVFQGGLVPVFSVTSPLVVEGISPIRDTVRIVINTNLDWTARIKDGATADAVLLTTEGHKSDTLEVVFGENKDFTSSKYAIVQLDASGRETIEIYLTQSVAVPYVYIETPEKKYIDPGVFGSLGGRRWFNVRSNVSWTAEVDADKSEATDISLISDSGEGNVDKFKVVVRGTNKDFIKTKKIVINFKYEGNVLCTHEMIQQKGSVLAFEFKWQEDSNPSDDRCWWFTDPAAFPVSTNNLKGTGTFTTPGGYIVGWKATTKIYIAGEGLYMGNTATDYLEFPAIEGHKLVRVTMVEKGGNVTPVITDTNGETVEGGAFSGSLYSKGVPYTWELPNTADNTKYRLCMGVNKQMKLSFLEIEYK